MNNKFYITSAIAYASKKQHIGNTYELILTDAIARFNRYIGKDVYFLTGSDEHGQKIQQLADESNIAPKEYVNGVVKELKSIADLMNISYDKYIRTTDEEHMQVVQQIFKKLYEQGDIYKGEYSGWYCTPCEAFWTQTQLTDGKCPDCGRNVTLTNEEAYFFKMSNYAERLMKHIDENPEFIQPESRKREMINNFLKPGLQDLCVSRTSFTWGIPVEFDTSHVTYVWLDALTNYISALGYSTTSEQKGELYKKYWPADVHIIGKDILRFHTIYWPIFLMALGEPLPKQIFGHPWLLVGADKMSKSVGNVIYADDLAQHFGVDAVRYYCLREMPYQSDGSISYENIIARYNSDLANTLGNLVNRTVAMVSKYFDGKIPPPADSGEFDEDLKQTALKTAENTKKLMETFRIADALEEIWNVVNRANKYIDETTPWVLAKDETKKARLQTVMYNLIETIRYITSLLSSFMPETSEKIAQQINAGDISYPSLANFGGTAPNTQVGTAVVLFARIDADEKLAEINN